MKKMSVYLGGRGKAGHLVSAATFPLHTPIVASSAAALATLALRLGGRPALRLLFSKSYIQLVKGFGASEERKALAKSWLSRIGVPLQASLADMAKLLCLPCSFLLFSAESQLPKLFEGTTTDIALADLAAALCSLVPMQTPDGGHFLDAELLLPFEVLASLLRPPPLFVVGPMEAMPQRFPSINFSSLVLSFSDRMLAKNVTSLPVFRLRTRQPFETLLLSATAMDYALRADAAAAFLCWFVACLLHGLMARRLAQEAQGAL